MSPPHRIYLDNAATSWPKPPGVYDAVDQYQREIGAPAGRGSYGAGQDVERRIAGCRRQIAELIGGEEARRVIFGFNGTDVLNIALHGMLRPGDHVVTSVAEHNSVLRPLRWLQDRREVSVSYVTCDGEGRIDPDAILQSVTPQTRLVALTHASNVTGALQPVGEVGRRLRDHAAKLLVDAAQSLGHVPIDVKAMDIDLLASSGHKGLLGPLGSGVLYMGPAVDEQLDSFRQGGTGTFSEDDAQPSDLPHKFEAGNLNVPGLLGLAAGVAYIRERGIDELRQHEVELSQILRDGLRDIEGLRLYGPADADLRTGVTCFSINGMEPQEVASLLDSAFNIQVRAGLHCAPQMHEALGTKELGGTVRLSPGPFTTIEHIESALVAIAQVAAATSVS